MNRYLFFLSILIISILYHACSAVGKETNKRSFSEKKRETIQKLQKLVTPKYKKQPQNDPKKGDIRKFLGGYKETEAEESFYKNYRGLNGSTLLMDVIKKGGESNDIQALLALEVDINATDRQGNTALHYVIKGRSKERKKINYTIVAQLLNAGADIHARNKEGETPLSIAQERRASSIVRKMLGNEVEKNG